MVEPLRQTPLPKRHACLALLRHGEDVRRAPALGTTAGDGAALSPRGGEQARAARDFLSPLDAAAAVVASPMARAAATARIVAGGRPVVSEPRLAGLSLGEAGDIPLSGLAAFDDVFAHPSRRPAGGESLEDLLARTRPVLDECAATGRDSILVAHRIVNAVLIADALGLPLASAGMLQQDAGAVNLFELRPAGPALLAVNIDPDDPPRALPAGDTLPDTTTTVERRVYLVRHAEAANVRIDGQMTSDVPTPLTERGRRQAAALGRVLAGVDAPVVYSSDIARAFETATALAGPRDVIADRGLREMALGNLDGHSVRDLFVACPGFLADPDVAPPGGETPAETARRGRRAVERILESDPRRDVIVVAHAAVIRAVLGDLLGIPMETAMRLRTDWASVHIVELAAGSWRPRTLNWTPEGVDELRHTRPLASLTDSQSWLLGR